MEMEVKQLVRFLEEEADVGFQTSTELLISMGCGELTNRCEEEGTRMEILGPFLGVVGLESFFGS
ncbi:hypothetical protein C5167_035498 [Papaver somniferum]|uniref:Uncharacterized protein n=1 Tax=Papaver somniferum TaxID=3469 RepID=A0A4Y7KK80_PAPSO|nr:hypothetical protein C5167_035498 [Papaver somniferum]